MRKVFALVFGLLVGATACSLVSPVDNATQVTTGAAATCYITTTDTVKCAGNLGGPGSVPLDTYGEVAVPIEGIPEAVTSVSAGRGHICASTDENAYCWGENGSGRLGDGTSLDSAEPVEVQGLPDEGIVEVASQYEHTCALTRPGEVYCWGRGGGGRLGTGSNANETSAALVELPEQATDIEVGRLHSCATLNDNSLWCWGGDANGQLGNGPGITGSNSPVQVTGLPEVVSVELGYDHSCAISTSAETWCWGDNSNDQIDPTGVQVDTPAKLESPQTFVQIALGNLRTCGIDEAGQAWCKGYGTWGALGNGFNSSSSAFVAVVGTDSSPVTALSTGDIHSCAIGVGADLRCWGNNSFGQLGATTPTGSSHIPIVANQSS